MNSKLKSLFKFLLPLALALLFYHLPLANLTEPGRRTGALFILAALFWILEVFPLYGTSLLIIMYELLFLNSQSPLKCAETDLLFNQSEIFSHLASPIIMLFLGGLFLAKASNIYKLDVNLAGFIIKSCGRGKGQLLFALMLSTAIFSMFMSNTATTAMMIAIALPFTQKLPSSDPLKRAIILSIPVAANIGGMGTPIGTPPNAVALAALEKKGIAFSFLEWMTMGVPLVVILLFFSWFLLIRWFPSPTKNIDLNIQGTFDRSKKAIILYSVFSLTVILWMTSSIHGFSSSLVAFIPVVIFSLTGVVDRKAMRGLSWDVLWLLAGGLALGGAMERSGFNEWLLSYLNLEARSPLFIATGLSMIGLSFATFISHTATANLLIPIAMTLSAFHPESTRLFATALAFACSLGMALPISTPPNALAYATEELPQKDLLKVGLTVSIVGFIITLSITTLWIKFYG